MPEMHTQATSSTVPSPMRATARCRGASVASMRLTRTTSTAQRSVAARIIASPVPKAIVPACPMSQAWPAIEQDDARARAAT